MGRHTNKASPTRLSRSMQAVVASPALILFASATRLILICNYDTANAAAMAANGGIIQTLLGSLIPLLPPFLPLLVLVLLVFRRWIAAALAASAAAVVSPAYDTWANGWNYAIHEAGNLVQRAASPEIAMLWQESPRVLICAGVGLLFAVLGAAKGWDSDDEPFDTWIIARLGHGLWGIIIAAACVLGLLFVQAVYRVPFDLKNASEVVRRPWIPAEQITLTADGAPRTYIGYVISTGDDWFEMLIDDDRTIVYVPADTVVSRTVCIPPGSFASTPFHKPLFELHGAQPPQQHQCDTGFRYTQPPVAINPPARDSISAGHGRVAVAR